MFKVEITTQKQEKVFFFNKKHIKEMQYISLTIATKLNNAYIMFYYTN